MNPLEQARATIDQVDAQMAELFAERMRAAKAIAAWKRQNGMPIRDPEREQVLLCRGAERISDPDLQGLYRSFLQESMALSRAYQARLLAEKPNTDGAVRLQMELGAHSYEIVVGNGLLEQAGAEFRLDRRVLIVTDSGVPERYATAVARQCKAPTLFTLPAGESSKCMAQLQALLSVMLEAGFTRGDCVVAVGGGVVSDLAGFAASCYMRGIDLYTVPTTLLGQVDASIGGKTAIDLDGVKNCVGAFWQPRGVLIDTDVLQTLPARQIANGMAEIIKMALTHDADLFSMLEADGQTDWNTVILRALQIKKAVVEADELESGVRRVLNFGHTLGHGIEAAAGLNGLLHGEAVALGMIPMCAPEVRARLLPILRRWGLPTDLSVEPEAILQAVRHDKKCTGDQIAFVTVPRIGAYEIHQASFHAFCRAVLPGLQEMKGEPDT